MYAQAFISIQVTMTETNVVVLLLCFLTFPTHTDKMKNVLAKGGLISCSWNDLRDSVNYVTFQSLMHLS